MQSGQDNYGICMACIQAKIINLNLLLLRGFGIIDNSELSLFSSWNLFLLIIPAYQQFWIYRSVVDNIYLSTVLELTEIVDNIMYSLNRDGVKVDDCQMKVITISSLTSAMYVVKEQETDLNISNQTNAQKASCGTRSCAASG